MSERDKAVFEALNSHAPKLVTKFVDLMVLRYNQVELGLVQYSRFKAKAKGKGIETVMGTGGKVN